MCGHNGHTEKFCHEVYDNPHYTRKFDQSLRVESDNIRVFTENGYMRNVKREPVNHGGEGLTDGRKKVANVMETVQSERQDRVNSLGNLYEDFGLIREPPMQKGPSGSVKESFGKGELRS